jgi:hypothetical protein
VPFADVKGTPNPTNISRNHPAVPLVERGNEH